MSLKFIVTLFLTVLCLEANATHIMGGTLGYKYIGKNGNKEVYTVTLELYSDCKAPFPGPGPMQVPARVYVFNRNGTYTYQSLRYMGAYSEIDVTPLCPDEAGNSSCSDPSSLLPGVYKYVYENDFELEGVDENWVFAFFGSGPTDLSAHYSALGLNAETVNWATGSGSPVISVLYLEARLNNTMGPNSSPQFTSPPVPFLCINKLAYYSPGAIDPDLDQLQFKLSPSWKVSGGPSRHDSISYYPPFTSVKPLPCGPDSFNFNPANGQMVLTPHNDTNSFVNIEVSEYRNGVKVGSSMRQTTFVLLEDCNNEVVNTPITDIRNADYTTDANGNIFLTGCEGLTDTMSFDVKCSDPNNDNVIITYSNLPAGASVDIEENGTHNPVVHFKWGLTEAQPATYFFYITYKDDGCPIATTKTIGYTITITPHNIEFVKGTRGSCAAVSDGKAWIIPVGTNVNYHYKWVDTTTGNIYSNDNSTNGDTLKNIPPGIYKVYARNDEGCGKNFFFTVDTTPLPTLNHPNDSTICEGMPILIAHQPEPETNYQWNTGAITPSITITNTGTYTVTALNHCGVTTDSVYYNFVKCNYCMFVPNVFSPNGDGKNDLFTITPTCLFETFKLLIFNRFGQMVYNSYSLSNSWDGTFNGAPAVQGTYYYSIQAKYTDRSKGTFQLNGDVTLVR